MTGERPAASPRRRRKSLGQHFLTDGRIANRIVAAAEADRADTVLEIGPGAGALTRRLVAAAGQVVAVELDAALAEALPQRLQYPPNLSVICADARTLDIAAAIGGHSIGARSDDAHSYNARPYKVVANLPYYAASPIIRRFLEAAPPPRRLVVMVQREVAQAMTAPPGAMSLLSVATQFYAAASVVTQAPPRAFRPAPRVASTVVKLLVRPAPAVSVPDRNAFFALVRAGFTAPRKQLRNSLMQGCAAPAETISDILNVAGIDAQRRPATLSLAEWAALDAAWPHDLPRQRNGQ